MNVAPFGTWRSPISAALLARQSVGLGQLAYDGDDVYWTESRPTEKGRCVLVRRRRGEGRAEVLPPEFSVRTRVHEYGGGDYTVFGGVVVFSNDKDQQLYRKDSTGAPRSLTPPGALRYADTIVDLRRRQVICVREDKRLVESREDVNTIVAIPLDGEVASEGHVLVSGDDFYSAPRLNRTSDRLAWLSWNRPDMPWDAAELWVGILDGDGTVIQRQRVAGGNGESVFQPEWSPTGELYFVSDRSGYWNLYRWREGKVEPVFVRDAECGLPQWTFRMSTYAFTSDHRLALAYVERGVWHMGTLDLRTGTFALVELPFTWITGVRGACVSSEPAGDRVAFMAGSPSEPTALVELDLDTGRVDVLCRAADVTLDPALLSSPEALEIPVEAGQTVHAFYYPPRNPAYVPPTGEKPPLLVRCHGGPTAATNITLSLAIQFWTSRGFAVIDVNYGGSTGYGRAYRERLRGRWGIVDVDDCVRAAQHLVQLGLAAPNRLAVSGGSAGGFTVLSALTFRNIFRAGASYYGISDLELMARDARAGNSHKFESRYDEGLVAPYPEGIQVYRDRSPLQHVDRLSTPVIFFQGLEDRVVLPNQTEQMVDALRKKGVPVAYIPFEGEGHGFRRAENIERALEAELYFYGRIFGIVVADSIAPVPIDNFRDSPT